MLHVSLGAAEEHEQHEKRVREGQAEKSAEDAKKRVEDTHVTPSLPVSPYWSRAAPGKSTEYLV